MLSIIIPSYQYPVYDLVKELHSQCSALAIPFEIIVRDDCSKNQFQNFKINQLSHSTYSISNKNIGLAQTRNYLISQAQFPWILLLDNDVMPKEDAFVKNYLQHTSSAHDIYFGGIAYKKTKPEANELLRWVYGIAREEQTAEYRNANQAHLFLSSNTLFKKQIFERISYDDSITQYGYEDLLFSKEALQKGFSVQHIENSVWHLKLDTSKEYLEKSKTALTTLHQLIASNKLDWTDTGITRMHHQMKSKKALALLRLLNKVMGLQKRFEKNLLSGKPKLKYFDLYRLLYFDALNSTKS